MRSNITLKDRVNVAKRFINFLFASFCRTPTHDNDPVANFQPIHGNDIHFLDIRNDVLIPSFAPKHRTIDFWHKLYEKYQVILDRMNDIAREEL